MATAPGKLLDSLVRLVQLLEISTVKATHAHQNQHVRAGDPPLELEGEQAERRQSGQRHGGVD